MEVNDAEIFEVTESSQVSDARRRIVKFGAINGLNEKAQDRLALVCTELATNLVKHTANKGGNLIAQILRDDDFIGIEIYSLDSATGMDTTTCMTDGVSSTGTLGTGLGAIKRMSDEFNIFSMFGSGTVVHSQIWNSRPLKTKSLFESGLTVPKTGEYMSGDKWFIEQNGDQAYCMLIDGLGHGVEACEAALLAKKRFRENLSKPPAAMIKTLHTALRGTRGAVGAVAKIDIANGKVDYCGLGNIAAIISDGTQNKHLVSLNGTLGYEVHKINEFSMPWTPQSTLVMFSDGLSSKTAQSIIDVIQMPASIIAGWLYQKNTKNNDDATVLVLKGQKSNG